MKINFVRNSDRCHIKKIIEGIFPILISAVVFEIVFDATVAGKIPIDRMVIAEQRLQGSYVFGAGLLFE